MMVREESITEAASHGLCLVATKKSSLESEWDIKSDEHCDGASEDENPLDLNPDREMGVSIIDNPIKIPFFSVFGP